MDKEYNFVLKEEIGKINDFVIYTVETGELNNNNNNNKDSIKLINSKKKKKVLKK